MWTFTHSGIRDWNHPTAVLFCTMLCCSGVFLDMLTPKGRIINSCTVNYQTVYMLIMETQVSKLTHACTLDFDEEPAFKQEFTQLAEQVYMERETSCR